MLLAERSLPGAGWVQAAGLAAYAFWLIGVLYSPRTAAIWRRRLWTFFSIVFFTQLAIGLAGVEQFLMSGDLHLPIPAMIIAGPLYRGEGLFMPILFGATLLLVGPAWCSYLCYVGSWDLNLAAGRRRPMQLPRWRHLFRHCAWPAFQGARPPCWAWRSACWVSGSWCSSRDGQGAWFIAPCTVRSGWPPMFWASSHPFGFACGRTPAPTAAPVL
jgi:hypothetical protein